MNKIFFFLRKNKDLLLIFIITFFLSSPYLVDMCSGYLNYNIFDLQSFLLWDYSLIKHLVIYRDLSYPYGILQYYKENNLLLLFLYYVIAPLNFTLIFHSLKGVIKNKYFLYISFALFYLFVFNVTGFSTFARYGILVAFSLLFSQLLFYQANNSKRLFLLIGIILGLIFFLVNDQGAYLFSFFIIIFFVNDLLKNNNINIFLSAAYYRSLIKKFFFLILGFIIGIFPLIIFLFYHNSISQFFYYFKDLKDVVVVAKTPFFNFVRTKDNLFIIFALYFSTIYLFIKLVFLKKRKNLTTLIQTALIMDILILEQKSIIRSVSTQITFVALILIILVFYELTQLKKTGHFVNKMMKVIYLFLITIILFAFQLTHNNTNNYDIKNVGKNLEMLVKNKCYENNFEAFLTKNPSYSNVYKYFKTQIKSNEKIFIFPPGDSVFYILLNQIPPYYNTVWNSSLINSQNEIKYVEQNDIKYIFLNTNTAMIQDGVPDHIRLPLVYKYILNNFYPLYKIDNYLILGKYKNLDFFNSQVLDSILAYKENLLNIFLNKIPSSEGLYKYAKLKKDGRLLIRANQVDKVNLFLSNNKLSSQNKTIVITSHLSSKSSDLSTLELITSEGYSTVISYNTCKKDAKCIINLANIPLFYKNRIINKISVEKDFDGNIEVFETNKKVNLW